MAKLALVIQQLNTVAPSSLALDFDNSGLNVGDENAQISGITLCLDVTKEVIKEAYSDGNNLIVSHHPIIFSPVTNLVAGYKTNDVIINAVEKGINLYSMHTNLDTIEGGVNDAIAQLLGMKNLSILDETSPNVGIGRVGSIEKCTIEELMKKINSALNTWSVTANADLQKTIDVCCIVNGAGASEEYLLKAKQMGAQVFISGEIKHHVALYARSINLPVINVGHYAMENFYMPLLKEKIDVALKGAGINLNVKITNANADTFDSVVR